MKSNRYFLNFLIVGYLGVIYFSGVPESNTLNFRLKQNAQKIAFGLGIWPSWSMFAPNPVKFDSKTYVEITYGNGEVKEMDVELEPKGLLSPFRKAKWMKYSQDNLRNPKQKGLLAPALRHFYHKHNTESNPVTNIRLKRKWVEMELFRESGLSPLWSTPRFDKAEDLITQKY